MKTEQIRLPAAFLLLLLCPAPGIAQSVPFQRGDANVSGSFELADVITMLDYIFLAAPSPGCIDAMDSNDDGRLSLTDPILCLRALFTGGRMPEAPFDQCGPDPTEDGLGCGKFPPCETIPPICLDQEMLNGLLDLSLETTLCIPAGLLNFPADPLAISVCPEAKAQPCGALQSPGCPLQLTGIRGSVDTPGKRLVFRLEGKMEDLPIDITESIFQTTATCTTDIHGEEAGLPFSFDFVIPLILEEESPGVFGITGTGEVSIENVQMGITAEGGLLCRLFQAGGDVFVGLLTAFLQETARGILQPLTGEVVGLKLCTTEGQ